MQSNATNHAAVKNIAAALASHALAAEGVADRLVVSLAELGAHSWLRTSVGERSGAPMVFEFHGPREVVIATAAHKSQAVTVEVFGGCWVSDGHTTHFERHGRVGLQRLH